MSTGTVSASDFLPGCGHNSVKKPASADFLYAALVYPLRELRGESCLALEEFAPTRQQVVCSRSFGSRITEYMDMRQAVCAFAEHAAEELRKERQYCRQITVFVPTSRHADGGVSYGNQATGKLLTPSNDTRDIIQVAIDAL